MRVYKVEEKISQLEKIIIETHDKLIKKLDEAPPVPSELPMVLET